MKITIVGAGTVGTALARLLAADRDVTSITCLSRNEADLARVRGLGSTKISTGLADAALPAAVVAAATGTDLIINASLPRFNESLLTAALEAHANYLDLASELEDLRTAEQLPFHEKYKSADRLALINAGVAPGLTNLLVRLLQDEHPDHDCFRIRLLEEQAGEELVFSWSPETTIDDVTAPPLVYDAGGFRLTSPFADAETFDFGPAVGRRTVYSLYGDEVATIPLFLTVRDLDFKSGGSDVDKARNDFLAGKIRRGMAPPSGIPVMTVAADTSDPGGHEPAGETRLVIAVVSHASGKPASGSAGYRVVFPGIREILQLSPGATYIAWPTAVSAYALLKAAAGTKMSGVLPPEAFDRPAIDRAIAILRTHRVCLEPLATGGPG